MNSPAHAVADAQTEPSSALAIEALTVSFPAPQGRVRVIEDVSLTIGRGEILGA